MTASIRAGVATLAFWILTAVAPAAAGDRVHHLALQITDNDAQKMSTVLNVAANVSRHYEAKGERVEIKVVAFNAGLHMLRADTSPVQDRIKSFSESMPNVTFEACNNTLEGMTKKEGKQPDLVASAVIVPSGAVELIELSETGWAVLRP